MPFQFGKKAKYLVNNFKYEEDLGGWVHPS